MSKPPATWKLWERLISAVFGLKRRGADYGDKSGGKNDAVQTDGRESEWWSLEIKPVSYTHLTLPTTPYV